MSSLLAAMMSEAIEEFETKCANLLACFDAVKTYQAMTSLAVLQDGGVPKPIVEALEKGDSGPHLRYQAKIFLTLLRRGAFNSFQVIKPLTKEADEELDKLEVIAGEKAAAPKPDPRKAQQDQLTEAVQAYRTLSSDQFKMHWLNVPAKRALFEQACAKGLV